RPVQPSPCKDRRHAGAWSGRLDLLATPGAIRPRLHPAAADGHGAPRPRAVPGLVEEEPAAGVVAAGLHPRPGTVGDGGDERREDARQVSLDSASRGRETPRGGIAYRG